MCWGSNRRLPWSARYQSAKDDVTEPGPQLSLSASVIGLSGNLPAALTSFIGREVEQAEVCSLLRSSALVTVTGAGGSGKTRLALEVAAQLHGEERIEAYLVELAPVTEAADVTAAFASALGVRAPASRPLGEVLAEALSGQDLLVVMDNCEHVIATAAELAELLNRRCPRLRLLATSREPLAIQSERVYRLGPMTLPPLSARSVKDLEGSDAVELFIERARAHDAAFALEEPAAELLASVCQRLDGIPLALELAAARVASMSLAHLNERLDQRFRLLTGGPRTAVPRQRTLQAAVDWSYELLAPPERDVLNRLSVFSGGFELEAAEAVCSYETVATADVDEALASLVNKNLVVAQRSSTTLRYSLLETIRQYGRERLLAASGEAELHRAHAAHARFYLNFAERAGQELHGPEQGLWLRDLDVDWDNLRTTLAFFLDEPDATEAVMRIGTALHYFLWTRCQRYGIDAVCTALSRPADVPAPVRAKALFLGGATLAATLGWDSEPERRAGGALIEQGLEMCRTLGDPASTSDALTRYVWVAESLGQHAKASECASEALKIARDVGDPWLIGNAMAVVATVATSVAAKRTLWQEAAAHLRRVGDLGLCSVCLASQAVLEMEDEQFVTAATLLEESIALSDEIGAPLSMYWSWGALGEALLPRESFEDAVACLQKALTGLRRLGLRDIAVSHLINVACCAVRLGKLAEATRLAGAYETMRSPYLRQAGTPGRSNRFERLTLLLEKLRKDNRNYLRRVLGTENFEREYSAGTMLTFDDAVELALQVAS